MNFEDSSQLYFLYHGGDNVRNRETSDKDASLKHKGDMFPASRPNLTRTRRKSSPDITARRLDSRESARGSRVESTGSDLSFEHVRHSEILSDEAVDEAANNTNRSPKNNRQQETVNNIHDRSASSNRGANGHSDTPSDPSWPWEEMQETECYNRMSKSYDNENWEQLDVSNLQTSVSNFMPFSNTNSPSSVTQSQPAKSSGFTSYLTNQYSGNFDADKESIKTKFISAWNNVRHGWAVKTKTNFKIDSQIWLLGKCYHCKLAERDNPNQRGPRNPIFEKFKVDFFSKIWFTYRKDFPVLPSSVLTSDVGWGCMLRSGQMMLAQALILHTLGRDWRWHTSSWHTSRGYHEEIIQFFADFKSQISPFSIHNLVEIGMEHGKQPGDWYGPASAAFVLREAVMRAAPRNPIINNLCLYIAQDCTIYKQDVINLCSKRTVYQTGNPNNPLIPHSSHHQPSSNHSQEHTTSHPDSNTSSNHTQQPSTSRSHSNHSQEDPDSMKYASWSHEDYESDPRPSSPGEDPWRSVIILVPVRLGGEAFNRVYAHCIKNLFTSDLCIGIIGGKPKHSLYFIGWQEDKLIHLDPHCCQPTVDVGKDKCALDSYHCSSPRKTPLDKIDPSCTIGFYCRSKDDFDRFFREVPEMATPVGDKSVYPMFVCSKGSCSDIRMTDAPQAQEKRLRIQRLDKKGRLKEPSKDSDDFVML